MKKVKESALSTGMGVPDSSGGRGGGRVHKAYQKGGAEYPYDKAAGTPGYGTPLAYDRGSSGNGGSRQNVNAPRNVAADDTRWSEEIGESKFIGTDTGTPVRGNIVYNPKEKSKFGEEDMEEAIGTPSSPGRADRGRGGSGGGRTTPGTSGEWSAGPKGGYFDNHMSDEKLDKAAKQDENNLPFISKGFNRYNGMSSDPRDETIPTAPTYDTELGKGAVILKVGGAGFGGTGKAMKHSRLQPGMSWRESKSREIHNRMLEAFVSLRDTPCGAPTDSAPMHVVNKDIDNEEFRSAHAAGREHMSSFSDGDAVGFMIKMDPEYFTNMFGKMGKDSLMNIYDEWANEVVSTDDIGGMTERIMKTCGGTR